MNHHTSYKYGSVYANIFHKHVIHKYYKILGWSKGFLFLLTELLLNIDTV